MHPPVYLDHQATTPCDPRVLEAMLPWFVEHFGNAGSRQHAWGLRAASAVDLAREQVASLIGARPREIVFTSGATESNNLALTGVAEGHAARGRHLVTCATEHKAVLDPLRHLATRGWSLTVLPPEPDGRLDPGRLRAALRPDTVLASFMVANNEIGVLHPVRELADVCHERGVLVHVDAAQATGKIPLDVTAMGVDLMSLTAHKTCGPKGVGALYVRAGRPRIQVVPLLHGGGQEGGLRSGTLPVPLLVGLGRCFALAADALAEGEPVRVAAQRDRLLHAALSLGGVRLNGSLVHRLPGNLSLTVHGATAAGLIAALQPIACSAGSACSTGTGTPSHVLTALGLAEHEARCTVRFGLGRTTTDADVNAACRALVETVPRVRDAEQALHAGR